MIVTMIYQAWLEAWKQRLEKETKSKASTWLNQQLPGPFWEQGSVDVDYEKITIPVLVIGESPCQIKIQQRV